MIDFSGLKVYLVAAACVVMIGIGGAVVYCFNRATLHDQANTIATLKGQVEALQVAQDALTASTAVRSAGRDTNGRNYDASRATLDSALSSADAWGSVPVPDAVARVLVAPLGASSSAGPGAVPAR